MSRLSLVILFKVIRFNGKQLPLKFNQFLLGYFKRAFNDRKQFTIRQYLASIEVSERENSNSQFERTFK